LPRKKTKNTFKLRSFFKHLSTLSSLKNQLNSNTVSIQKKGYNIKIKKKKL
jgi:hypothetical protein